MTRIEFVEIAVISVSVSLAGCIPSKFSGFMPAGPGSLESSYCVAGIRDRLRMHAPHGVDVLLFAAEDDGNHAILLDASLAIPEGVTVRLLSPELLLRSPEWTQARTLTIDRITGGAARRYEPSAVLPGSSQESTGAFTLWFLPGEKGMLWQTGLPTARRFTVSLPALDIDGEAFQAETVTFDAFRRWGTYTCAQ